MLRNTSPNAEATHTEEEAYSFVRSDGAGNRCGQDGYVVVNANPKSRPLLGDNPISDHGDDVLERAGIADAFARQVLTLDASKGTTVGVFGPWGSGKTSFVNLTRETFNHANVPVLDFNPWMFSGAEQLVERFFSEMSASMGVENDLKEIAQAFGRYGAAINAIAGTASALLALPQIGAIVKAVTKAAGSAAQPESIDTLRRRIEDALRERGKPIVVVLDDVDRLSSPEIREVIKLVRLTASFPNLIYIVSCDRLRVEQALGERGQGLSGRDYLEKIIQWSSNLPEIPSHLLTQQLEQAIERALADIENPGPLDREVWSDVHAEIVRPLIRNMRDVRRYAIAIRATVDGLDGQVALADVLALEAIGVFLPDVFRLLPGAIDGLTGMTQAVDRRIDRMTLQIPDDLLSGLNKWLKAQVDGLIVAAEKDREPETARKAREVVEAIVGHLFPVGARLRILSDGDSAPYANDDAAEHFSERRVAHEHIFRRYLERTTSPELLTSHAAERALARMTDRHGLNEFIRALEPTRWQDIVANLCDLADRFRREHVEPGVVVLLGLWPDMPEQPSSSSILGDDARGTIRRATLRLLRVLEGPAAVETAVRRILPQLTSLSSKVELVLQVGHRENSGHKLVSETTANEFETMLRDEIRAASADDLAEEREPLRVLVFAKHYGGPSEDPFDIDDSPRLTFSLLRSTRWEAATTSSGGLTVTLSPALSPKTLIELYDGKDTLEARINDLKAGFDTVKPWFDARGVPLDEAEQLLELAERYLSGWRPETE